MRRADDAPGTLKSIRPAAWALVWTPVGWQWLPVIVGIVLLYEVLRIVIVGGIKRRYERNVQQFMRQQGIPDDPFRHTHRVVVKERVLDDPGLRADMLERARTEDRSFHDVELKVREWLDEIVPQFNLLAYYKVGYRIGRLIAYSTYNVRLDQASLAAAREAIPANAAVVYVSNHRSNADFVVTGFMLSKSVQISYAVGEWARIWPLESLFKAFGSYFVRRGEKDALYHRTLEAYLQLITKQGVTQAMFPEGGLTRDGNLRPVKLGLLDYMARCKLDPSFDKPLVFVPVGINFDRVMEDENMVAESLGQPRVRRSLGSKFVRLITGPPRLLVGGTINVVRFATKRLKKHGIAAIHFGQPIVFDEWMEVNQPALDESDRHARQEAIRPFGQQLLDAIGQVIPATPVTLVAAALRNIGHQPMQDGVDRGVIIMAMRKEFDRLRKAGRPLALDDPYRGDAAALFRRQETADLSAAVDESEVLARALELALDVTSKRGIFWKEGERYYASRWELIGYYANSVAPSPTPLVRVDPTIA